MKLGEFTDGGKHFRIHTPFTPTPWVNKLFNDEIHVDITQRMQGGGYVIQPDFTSEKFNRDENRFYLNVNGKPYELFRNQGVNYSCVHSLAKTEITETFSELTVKASVFVPVRGKQIFWTVAVTNNSKQKINAALFSLFPFYNPGYMSYEARYNENGNFINFTGFPYYVKYEDKAQMEEKVRIRYIMSDVKVASYECNCQRFYGCDDRSVIPAAVITGKCENAAGVLEDCVGVMQHSLSLEAYETKTINILLGIESDMEDIIGISKSFPDFNAELKKVEELWDKRCECFMLDTPDLELNYLTNYWLKKQLTYFARLNRGGPYCPVRNQLQDYLGYAILDSEAAFQLAIRVVARQKHNGYLKQYYNTNNTPEQGLCLMEHSDSYVWLIICLIEIIERTGNPEYYNYPVGYIDSSIEEPVIVHLKKAAHYMSTQTGPHGLCLILDGDWNDPVNGPGHLGRGESTWNSMALCYAIRRLNEIDYDDTLEKFRVRLEEAINRHCWDGEWYIAGISDNGIPYGCHHDKEAQKFLNTQTWAIISGVAKGERLRKTAATIESMKVPFGYTLIDPPFSEYNPVWGRVSLKMRGTTENGSVYCHAVMFKALADCMRGDGNTARDTILSILPSNSQNPPEKNLQIPTCYSNYYFGYKDENFGRSSCHYRTGTVAWHFWVVLEHMMGMRTSTANGISVKPCLPDAWKNATLVRKFAGETYSLVFNDGIPELRKL